MFKTLENTWKTAPIHWNHCKSHFHDGPFSEAAFFFLKVTWHLRMLLIKVSNTQ